MSKIELFFGDCFEVMKGIEEKSIDLVATDPPYGISRELTITRNKNGMKFRGKDVNYNFGEWDRHKDIIEFTFIWIDAVDKLLKNDSNFILFFDRDKINHVADYLKNKGYKRRNYIYFVKNNPVPQARKINWQSSVEQGVILSKGKPKYNYKQGQHTEDWRLPICGGHERTKHPTQKPIKIFSDIVNWWSFENDVVLDPFMGSGTTGVACKNLNRNFIGIEKDAEYYKIAKNRIENFKPQQNLDFNNV